MAFFALGLTLLLTLISDILRLDDYDWLWLVPWAMSSAVCLLLGIVISLWFSKIKSYPFFWLINLFVGAMLGAVKNISVNYFAGLLGLTEDDLWVFRFLGGMFMGLAMVGFYALSTGARYDHRVAVSKLRETQERLLAYRHNLTGLVERENVKLISVTQEVLIPKLRRIENLLSDSSKLNTVIDEMRSTIEHDIRPLTRDVTQLVANSELKFNPPSEVKLREVKLPKFAEIVTLLRPGRVLAFNSMAYLWFFYLIDGLKALPFVLVAVVADATIQFAFKQTFTRRLESLKKVLLKMAMVGAVGSLPFFYLVHSADRPISQYTYLDIMVVLVSFGSLYLNGYGILLDEERAQVENELNRENESLEHDISIAEQRIWVFKKSWQLVLHGTVQAALTAALTRLSLKNEQPEILEQLVRQDLKRAEDALHSNPSRTINFDDAAGELVNAWRGVCEVKIEASERAKRALRRHSETMFCLNELMRESVSNAVRHGAARRIEISIDRVSDNEIQFMAKNDGLPVSSKIEPGVGSQTLDDLTLEWQIKLEKRSGMTTLTAVVAVDL